MTDPHKFLVDIDEKINECNSEKSALDSEVATAEAEHKARLEGINAKRSDLATKVSNLETTRERVAWYASTFFPKPDAQTQEQTQEQDTGT